MTDVDPPRIPRLEGDAQAAVEHRGGHLQIIASAGSGKTEVVSQRIAALLAEGTKPESLVTVFVPTNHLYLGDIVLVPADAVIPTGLSIDEGIRIIVSAGTAGPRRIPSPGGSGSK